VRGLDTTVGTTFFHLLSPHAFAGGYLGFILAVIYFLTNLG